MTSKNNVVYQRQRFDCDCQWAFHGLDIENDEGMITVQVVNAPRDLNLWQRIQAAWYILLGTEHIMSEIVVAREDERKFVDFVSGLHIGGNDEQDWRQRP